MAVLEALAYLAPSGGRRSHRTSIETNHKRVLSHQR